MVISPSKCAVAGGADRLTRHDCRHSDVLSAAPSSPEQVQELVSELRRRGNAAFKAKSFYEAEVLYGKAIELEPEGDPAVLGNRSAARIGMKKFSEALEDADAAAKKGWTKGHFRRGQALAGLNKFREAQQAYEQCASLDPSNAEAKREAEKMKAKADQDENSMDVEDTSKVVKDKSGDSASANQARAPKKKAERDSSAKDEDDASLMKGYKTLDDGRKTTYFHREISAEQKEKLARENRPVALQGGSQPKPASNPKDGSAWNAAGTFEEKDHTKWAEDKIKSVLGDCSTVFEAPGGESGVVEVTSVSDFDGVASVSIIRGSRRYPFDFTFNVNWTASIPQGEIKGKLFFSQFASDDDDFQAEVKCDDRSKAGSSEAALIKHIKTEFRAAVDSQLRLFISEFREL